MKVLSTDGLTKLIQLIKGSYISVNDTVSATTVTLSPVATSGSFTDLIDTPEIPTNLSDLTDDLGSNPIHTHSQYLTAHQDISGKQDIIDSSHKLSSDLVDDTNQTHKFVSTSEKTTWNSKQDAISDLSTIRSGAQAGASALQSGDNISELINDAEYLVASDISNKADKATSLSGYGITDAYTKTEIDGKLASGMHYKGTKSSVSALPSTGNETGDLWNVDDTGSNYAWNGSSWDKLSENIDLSGLVPTTTTVNGKALSGNITLTYTDVNALPASTSIPSKTSDLTNHSNFITNADIPTNLSDFTDDLGSNPTHTHSQYLTEHQDISGKQDKIDSTHKLSADLISEGTTNKLVSSAEKTNWNSKQDALVSGTNIKTINNNSILGTGNINISGSGSEVIIRDWSVSST